MKRIALTLAALAAIGSFAACKKDTKKSETETTSPADPSATKPTDTAATPATPADPTAAPTAGVAPAGAAPTDPAAAPATGAAPTDPAAGGDVTSTGIPECDSYAKRLMSCDKYSQQGKDAVKTSLGAWKTAHDAGGEAAKAVADSCKKAEEAADQSLKGMGC